MRRFLLINSFVGYELYFDDADSFEAALFASLCGMAKVARVLVDDTRACSVIEICDVSKEYSK